MEDFIEKSKSDSLVTAYNVVQCNVNRRVANDGNDVHNDCMYYVC